MSCITCRSMAVRFAGSTVSGYATDHRLPAASCQLQLTHPCGDVLPPFCASAWHWKQDLQVLQWAVLTQVVVTSPATGYVMLPVEHKSSARLHQQLLGY